MSFYCIYQNVVFCVSGNGLSFSPFTGRCYCSDEYCVSVDIADISVPPAPYLRKAPSYKWLWGEHEYTPRCPDILWDVCQECQCTWIPVKHIYYEIRISATESQNSQSF